MSDTICTKKLAIRRGLEPFCRCPWCNAEREIEEGGAPQEKEKEEEGNDCVHHRA